MSESISEERLIQLKNELVMAEKLAEDKLKPQMRQALERYTSKHVPQIARDWDVILNEIYPIIQYELPAIHFRTPRAYLKPRNKNYFYKKRDPLTGEMTEVTGDSSKSAKTQESILNYTIQEIRYKQEVNKTLLDALLFKHGVLWHGYKGSFGMTDEMSFYIQEEQVFVKRISPMQFLFDPMVTLANIEEARWICRSFDVPLQDILDDEDLEVDKGLRGELGYALNMENDKPDPQFNGGYDTRNVSSRTRTLLDYTDDQYRKLTGARFVRLYEFFVRPTKKERLKGERGKLVLYTKSQKKPLRVNAWPYKVDDWPAKILMFNEVPDSIFGVSDGEIWWEIADQKNAIVNLQLRNAQENSKNIVFYDKSGLDEATVQKIERGEQGIVGVPGPVANKVAFSSPSSAVSQDLFQTIIGVQNNLDEKSGVMDIKKGILRSGEESATSVEIRTAGASLRPAYRQEQMADFLKESFLFLNHLLKQFMPIKEAVRITGSLDIEWSEDPTKEELQADVDVELDAISMLPENPEKEVQQLTTILNLMQQALDDPAMFQKLQQEGYTFNLAPVIENLLLRLRIRDPEVFRTIRPEESQGFASVSELKAAQANTEAVLSGKQMPSPPQPGQDHNTRIEAYQAAQRLLQLQGQVSQILNQLVMVQTALAQDESEKKSPKRGARVKLNKGGIKQPQMVG